MRPLSVQIDNICLPTGVRDPRDKPDGSFSYVDISSIDRNLKLITSTLQIAGVDAPSRARKEIATDDVLVSTVRPNLNAVAMVPPYLNGQIASTGLCVLRPIKSVVDGKFLFYFTRTSRFIDALTSKVRGAHYPAVSDQDVRAVDMLLPSPTEQRRIVEILDLADSFRKKRSEADAKAARILPALFLKMFGDPATNPKKWPTEKLGDLFDIVGGGTPSKTVTAYWSGNIPWVSPKDMKHDVIIDSEDHITPEAIERSATRIVNKGSILIVYRSGILAHSFPIAFAGRDVAINQDLKALSQKSTLINEYLYGWINAAKPLVMSCVKKGATVQNVDGSRFLSLQVTKPPRPLQSRFAAYLEVLLRQKEKRQLVGGQIDSLFNVLLHRAFSGDLTANWREAHMKELLVEMEQQAKYLSIGA